MAVSVMWLEKRWRGKAVGISHITQLKGRSLTISPFLLFLCANLYALVVMVLVYILWYSYLYSYTRWCIIFAYNEMILCLSMSSSGCLSVSWFLPFPIWLFFLFVSVHNTRGWNEKVFYTHKCIAFWQNMMCYDERFCCCCFGYICSAFAAAAAVIC